MVTTGCYVVIGDGRHRVAIVAIVVPVIGFGVHVSSIWVVAGPSEADGYVPSSDEIDPSWLIPPRVGHRMCLSRYCRYLGSF